MPILDPDPPEFPSLWAVSYGEDSFGLWQAFEINGVRQVMRWIGPGQFQMGSPENEDGRHKDEKRHTVTLTRGYWLADTACTQSLWQSVTGDNPSHNKASPDHPVERVSWDDCQSFVIQCNRLLGGSLDLRLPTEAEWEYACRAGTETAYWWGDKFNDKYANTGNDGTVPVLQYSPNPFGLFQVHGNVLEWCEDWFAAYPDIPIDDPTGPEDGQHRVLRGGCWFSDERDMRSAFRNHGTAGIRFGSIGLRLAGG